MRYSSFLTQESDSKCELVSLQRSCEHSKAIDRSSMTFGEGSMRFDKLGQW